MTQDDIIATLKRERDEARQALTGLYNLVTSIDDGETFRIHRKDAERIKRAAEVLGNARKNQD